MSNNFKTTLFELILMESTQPDGQQRRAEGGGSREIGHREKMLVNFSQSVCREWGTIKNFLEECRQLTDREGRIQILKPHFSWIPATQTYKDKFMKSNHKSAAYLEKARQAFNNGRCQEALLLCNQSIAFAPPKGPDLASAFYWRSLILYQLHESVGALEDLELALATHNFPRNNPKSIYGLRTTFQTAIDQLALNLMKGDVGEEENLEKEKNELFVNDIIFRLKCPNPLAPAMEDFVKIEQNLERGRHLVVTRDVPIGTTILVETPIVSVLDGTLKRTTINCHHCLKKCRPRISCPNCVFAMFCTEACQTAAQAYHQYECLCLGDLAEILREGVTDNFYLAFKLICVMGPGKMYKIFETTPPRQELGDGKGGQEPKTGVYDSQSYHTVCQLVSIFEPMEILYPLMALMLAHTLEENCPNFFQLVPQRLKLKFCHFIAQTLLHHFESFSRNVFSLGNHSVGELGSLMGEFEQFASRILPTASLINHSCDPNVKMFSISTFGTCALITLGPLKRGDELLISYGPLFYADDINERQKLFRQNYHFECTCPPCQEGWKGIEQNFELDTPKFCCPQCSFKLVDCCDATGKENEMMSCVLINSENKSKCPSCGLGYEVNEILKKFGEMQKSSSHAHHLLDERSSPLEAIEAFVNIIPYFLDHLVQPSFDRVMNQEFFSQAVYKIIQNFDK